MCLQAQQRGRQPTPTSQTAGGWDPASWSGGASPFSGLFGSPVPGILNLSDYVDPPSVQQTTGQRSTPSAAAGSAEQLQGAGHQHAHSVSDDVTEHERECERDQTWCFNQWTMSYVELNELNELWWT